MKIASNRIVAIQFELTNGAGTVLDSASAAEPLEYLHGSAGILPLLEQTLTDRSAGDSFDLTIPPDQGFGEHQPGLVEVVPRNLWADPGQLAVGATVERTDPKGNKQAYVIRALDAETVTVDGNHPLAGETLRFRGKVVEVREATTEELAAAGSLH